MDLFFIIDAILILIIVFTAVNGYLRGLILSAAHLFGAIIAYFLGRVFATNLAPSINEGFIKPLLIAVLPDQFKVETPLASGAATMYDVLEHAGFAADAATAGLTSDVMAAVQSDVAHGASASAIRATMESMHVPEDTIIAVVKSMSELQMVEGSAMPELIDALTSAISYGLVFFIAVCLVFIVISFIGGVLDRFFELPLYNPFNKLGGIACGLVLGIGIVCTVAFAFSVFLQIFSDTFQLPEIMDFMNDAGVLKFFAENNPFSPILMG